MTGREWVGLQNHDRLVNETAFYTILTNTFLDALWIVPLFTLMATLGLVNSYMGLIAPGLSAPFGLFLMRQFIQTLPTELIEAATIDGCSEIGIFRHIILPLSKPGLAVLGIFVFMGQWNAFLWPLIVVNSSEMMTLTVGFALLSNRELRVNYGALMAAVKHVIELCEEGHPVTIHAAHIVMAVGGAQGIMIDPDSGTFSGGADPRRDGYAIGW